MVKIFQKLVKFCHFCFFSKTLLNFYVMWTLNIHQNKFWIFWAIFGNNLWGKTQLSFFTGEHNVPPPMDPSDYCQYLRYDPQNFFGKKHAYLLIWPTQNFGRLHFRPKIQALEKKKGKKWQLCFTPWIIAKNDQKNSKFFLVNV